MPTTVGALTRWLNNRVIPVKKAAPAIVCQPNVVVRTTLPKTIAGAAFLTGMTLLFSQRVKAPTVVGMARLDQIEGFRLFLQSVERLPMDREDAPSDHA